MPKVKTKKAVLKRFKLTASGKVRRYKAGASHLLSGKSAKRRRRLRKVEMVKGAKAKTIKVLLAR